MARNSSVEDGGQRFAQHCRSMVGTALHVGQDRPETQYATKDAARFISGLTRAVRCSNDCASVAAKRRCSAGHFLVRKCRVRSELSGRKLGRGTGSVAHNVVRVDLFRWPSARGILDADRGAERHRHVSGRSDTNLGRKGCDDHAVDTTAHKMSVAGHRRQSS